MKLVVFGATGRTGSQVVEQALAAGHTVTAIARHPAAITIQHERLEVIQGDVLEPSTLAVAIAGKAASRTSVRLRTKPGFAQQQLLRS